MGGTGDPQSVYTPGIPAGPRENIEYPASIRPVGGAFTGDDSITRGSEALDSQARAYRAACPDTQIDAHGYSLGAVVVSDVCDEWQTDDQMNRNTACTTVGNPKRSAHDGSSGIMEQLPQVVPGLAMTADHSEGGPIPVTEVCNANDIICNAPNPVLNPFGFANGVVGYYTGDHGYPQPMPESPGDHLYPQQPRVDGAGPTVPALRTVPTVPEVLNGIVPGVSPEPVQPVTPSEPVPAEPEPVAPDPQPTLEVEMPGGPWVTDPAPNYLPDPVVPDDPALARPETPDLIVRVGRALEVIVTGPDAGAGDFEVSVTGALWQ